MARGDSNPTIKILILGAEGVGKNCLESQFTTATYPPLYNPALTLTSRRFLTLSGGPPISNEGPPKLPLLQQSTSNDGAIVAPPAPVAKPKTGPHKRVHLRIVVPEPASKQRWTVAVRGSPTTPTQRSRSTSSSMYSSASHPSGDAEQHPPSPASTPPSLPPPSHVFEVLQTKSASPIKNTEEPKPPPVTVAVSAGEQYCVTCTREARTFLVELTNVPELQSARERSRHLADGYDAVLLVYDVGDRASFEAAAALHSEIPGAGRRWRRRRTGETVVALVGNKADLDDRTIGDGVGRSIDKTLSREISRVFDDIMLPPLSPGATSAAGSVQPATPPGDVELEQYDDEKAKEAGLLPTPRVAAREVDTDRDEHDGEDAIEEWIRMSSPMPGVAARQENVMPTVESKQRSKVNGTKDWLRPRRRQVSRQEGEELAHNLLLGVPYMETSAKTGVNVESTFETVIRSVLREMGRELGDEGVPCHCKHGHQQESQTVTQILSPPAFLEHPIWREESQPHARQHPLIAPVSRPAPIRVDTTFEAEITAVDDTWDARDPWDSPITPPIVPQPKQRRGSMLDRFRMLFHKPSPVVDVEAQN